MQIQFPNLDKNESGLLCPLLYPSHSVSDFPISHNFLTSISSSFGCIYIYYPKLNLDSKIERRIAHMSVKPCSWVVRRWNSLQHSNTVPLTFSHVKMSMALASILLHTNLITLTTKLKRSFFFDLFLERIRECHVVTAFKNRTLHDKRTCNQTIFAQFEFTWSIYSGIRSTSCREKCIA